MPSFETITLRVAVGSTNPSKIRSVQQALEAILIKSQRTAPGATVVPKVNMHGISVPSGVPDQPMGDAETKKGAYNRAKACYHSYLEKFQIEPHLAIGLEGGLEVDEGDVLACMAWIVVFGKRSTEILDWTSSNDCNQYHLDTPDIPSWGIAKTASFFLPPQICALVKDGLELGDADDQVFSRFNGKHGSGTVGILTNGLIDRSLYYEHAIHLAMIPWIRPDVYP